MQAEGEDRTGRLEALKKAMDLENEKLKENMEEKEALVKVSLSFTLSYFRVIVS